MSDVDRFEALRPRMRGIAYGVLGSMSEADDAVQEAWLRYDRQGAGEVDDLSAWLSTVVARVSLDMLRARTRRAERPDTHVPDPIVGSAEGGALEDELLLADSVGLALLVVLDTLSPPERLAFVLHDVFAMPFADIAPVVERTPEATRQLASRARRRVRGAAAPEASLARQRSVVDAFFAAAREGDFDGLVTALDPDVTLRSDGGAARPEATATVHGAQAVARRALMFARPDAELQPVVVNGSAGVVVRVRGRAVTVMGFAVAGERIVAVDALNDPERVARLGLDAD